MANPVRSAGDRAPPFTLHDDPGRRVRLTELRGKWVVLSFLPKAMSATCTAQACALQEAHEEFLAMGAEVLCAGPDDAVRQRLFRESHELAFPLLIDRDAKLASRYGVFRERRTGGRSYAGMVRATFLIDPSGRISQLWDNLRVKGHVPRVLDRLREELDELA